MPGSPPCSPGLGSASGDGHPPLPPPQPCRPGNLAVLRRAPERWAQTLVCVEQTPPTGGWPRRQQRGRVPALGEQAPCVWSGAGQAADTEPGASGRQPPATAWAAPLGALPVVGAPEGLKRPYTLAPVGLHTPAQSLGCLPARSRDAPAPPSSHSAPGLTATYDPASLTDLSGSPSILIPRASRAPYDAHRRGRLGRRTGWGRQQCHRQPLGSGALRNHTAPSPSWGWTNIHLPMHPRPLQGGAVRAQWPG